MSSPYSEINSSPTDNSTPYIVRQLVNSPDAANLYESVKSQNKMIDVESSSLRDKYSTDNQRSKYKRGIINDEGKNKLMEELFDLIK